MARRLRADKVRSDSTTPAAADDAMALDSDGGGRVDGHDEHLIV